MKGNPFTHESLAALPRMIGIAIFSGAMLVAVVDYGAVSLETRVVLSLAIYATLAFCVVTLGLPAHTRGPAMLACGLLAATGVVVVLQTGPFLSSVVHPAWKTAALFSLPDVAPVRSPTPADDRLALLTVALPVGFFLVGLVLFDTDERAARLLRVLAVGGGIVAVWSILQFQFLPKTLVFGEKRFYRDSLTGFFVNRNTAATFFGLVVLLLFSRVWQQWRGLRRPLVWASLTSGVPLPPADRRAFRLFVLESVLLAAAFTALMLTRSRGGVGSTFMGLLLLIALLRPMGRRESEVRAVGWSRLRRLLPALVAVAVFAVFSGGVLFRASVVGLAGDSRFCFMPGVLRAIGDNLPLGSGLASFEEVHAPYAEVHCGIYQVVTRAHNVYLEGLLTLGLAFVPMALAFVGGLGFIFLRGMRHRKRHAPAGAVGLAALLVVLLHSAVDFSLQIPGFAIAFAVTAAPLTTLCLRPSARERVRRAAVSPAASAPAD